MKPIGIYRHKKRGTTYRLMSENALFESDKSDVVVYQCLEDGQVWVRSKDEFFDGRFERVE